MSNTNLPDELREQIAKEAAEYAKCFKHGGEYRYLAYADGATEYAIKYQREKVEAEEWKLCYEVAVSLLRTVVQRHEAGLLPDRHIYHEIKTFLDGSK